MPGSNAVRRLFEECIDDRLLWMRVNGYGSPLGSETLDANSIAAFVAAVITGHQTGGIRGSGSPSASLRKPGANLRRLTILAAKRFSLPFQLAMQGGEPRTVDLADGFLIVRQRFYRDQVDDVLR